jgi:hypothetical protein
LAQLGPWWVSIVVGVLAAGFVMLFGRWRTAMIHAQVGQLPEVDRAPGRCTAACDRLGTTRAGVAATAVTMGLAVAAVAVGVLIVSIAALLVYLGGLFGVVSRMVRRIGELPAEHRPARTWRVRLGAALGSATLLLAPISAIRCPRWALPQFAILCAVAVAGVVWSVGRWQLSRLRLAAGSATAAGRR